MKLLITHDGEKYFFQGEDVHTRYGYVSKDDINNAKFGDAVQTNKGKKMTVINSSFNDSYLRIRRAPQIIPKKDIGLIFSEIMPQKDWIVVDAGSGSGGMCCFIAPYVKKVYSYDIRDDHINITLDNKKNLGLKNLEIKNHDIYLGIPKKKVNLLILDVPEPWKAVKHAVTSLVPGGYIVSYSPCLPQVSDFVEEVRKYDKLAYIKTSEIIERVWEVEGRKIRPMSQPIGHSGFLS